MSVSVCVSLWLMIVLLGDPRNETGNRRLGRMNVFDRQYEVSS
jgi:hypothetical protein